LAIDFNYHRATEGIELSGGLLRNAVERALLKMERAGLTEMSSELVRLCIVETEDKNDAINRKVKTNGIA
jgi:hypothetical protein